MIDEALERMDVDVKSARLMDMQIPKADIILHQDPEHLAEPHRNSL